MPSIRFNFCLSISNFDVTRILNCLKNGCFWVFILSPRCLSHFNTYYPKVICFCIFLLKLINFSLLKIIKLDDSIRLAVITRRYFNYENKLSPRWTRSLIISRLKTFFCLKFNHFVGLCWVRPWGEKCRLFVRLR